MKISDELVVQVCALARLGFEEGELERFQEQFGQIIEYVEKIGELNLDELQPTSHAIERANAFRADEVKKMIEREVLLANAPIVKGGFIVTPKVIEEL